MAKHDLGRVRGSGPRSCQPEQRLCPCRSLLNKTDVTSDSDLRLLMTVSTVSCTDGIYVCTLQCYSNSRWFFEAGRHFLKEGPCKTTQGRLFSWILWRMRTLPIQSLMHVVSNSHKVVTRLCIVCARGECWRGLALGLCNSSTGERKKNKFLFFFFLKVTGAIFFM